MPDIGGISVQGLTGLRAAIKQEVTRRGMASSRALRKTGLLLQRYSQEIVPVDTGALKNSAFTRASGSGFDTEVRVGYQQSYAVYVHEIPAKHNPGQQWKFLSTPARTRRTELADMYRRTVREHS